MPNITRRCARCHKPLVQRTVSLMRQLGRAGHAESYWQFMKRRYCYPSCRLKALRATRAKLPKTFCGYEYCGQQLVIRTWAESKANGEPQSGESLTAFRNRRYCNIDCKAADIELRTSKDVHAMLLKLSTLPIRQRTADTALRILHSIKTRRGTSKATLSRLMRRFGFYLPGKRSPLYRAAVFVEETLKRKVQFVCPWEPNSLMLLVDGVECPVVVAQKRSYDYAWRFPVRIDTDRAVLIPPTGEPIWFEDNRVCGPYESKGTMIRRIYVRPCANSR